MECKWIKLEKKFLKMEYNKFIKMEQIPQKWNIKINESYLNLTS